MNVPVSMSLFSAVLGASLLGSLHCAAMCGPFVAVFSASGPTHSRKGKLTSHVAYHGGRMMTYVGLGALAGALGAMVDFAFETAGVMHVAALISGAVVILGGLGSLFSRNTGWSAARPMKTALVKLGTQPRAVRASALGLLTPLLPCGWLYAFVLTAGGTGTAWGGAAVMLSFWLGTVPALVGIGVLLSKLGNWVGSKLPALTAVALIVVGLVGIWTRTHRPMPAGARDVTKARVTSQQAQSEVPGAGHDCH